LTLTRKEALLLALLHLKTSHPETNAAHTKLPEHIFTARNRVPIASEMTPLT